MSALKELTTVKNIATTPSVAITATVLEMDIAFIAMEQLVKVSTCIHHYDFN